MALRLPAFGALTAAALAACSLTAAPLPALAQSAVPLTPELLDLTWAIISYNGQIDDEVEATTLAITGNKASGITSCGTEWSADVSVSLPQIRFSNVVSNTPESCPNQPEVRKFLVLLPQIHALRTGTEGLEFLSRTQDRVMLGVAGG